MKQTFVLSLVVAFTLSLNACAFSPQKAVLQPQLAIAGSDVGKGKQISLKVVDDRPKKSLGHRGSAYGPAAEITSDQDIAEVIHGKISEGLRADSFHVLPVNDQSPLSMKVEIRLLEYSTSKDIWSGGVHTRAAFKVVCKNGPREFEKLYRQENEERVQLVPTAEKNEQLINDVVSQLLTKIFMDQELIGFLAN